MFIRDESADEIVLNNPRIQDLVHGRIAMAWLPGQAAGVGAQACLMFGGAGTGLSILWLSTFTTQHFMCFMVGGAFFAIVHGLVFYSVLRGRPMARTRAYRFSIAMMSLSTFVAVLCLVRGAKIPLAIAVAGLAFNAIATRLIAGPGYALLYAIFRAQRAHIKGVGPILR